MPAAKQAAKKSPKSISKAQPRSKPRAQHRIVPPAPYTLDDANPKVDALVHELIGRVADKWTMVILDVLEVHGELRFTQLANLAGNISQKMLTQTLRQMERDGLIVRTVHPVVPPKVEYRLTNLGLTLGAAFCGVWEWALMNFNRVAFARDAFDNRIPAAPRTNA
jgi:DNA-binding HxlR family transcriptional regulator